MDNRRNRRRGRDTYYGIQLLDDLHNYFPDILYNPSRFHSVANLLTYISNVAREIERPYDAGLNDYMDRWENQHRPTPILHTTQIDISHVRNLLDIFNQADLQLRQEQTDALSRPTTEQIERSTSVVTIECGAEDRCSICHDNYIAHQRVRRINHCGHYFHELCIDLWLHDHFTCPICRHSILSEDDEYSDGDDDSSLG